MVWMVLTFVAFVVAAVIVLLLILGWAMSGDERY